MKELTLKIPGYDPIQVPSGVPTGGLEQGGVGQRLIQLSIEIFIVVGILLSLFYLLSAGWTWMTSGGDKTAIQSARDKLYYAIIGLIVVFMAFLLVRIIGSFFDVELLRSSLIAPSCPPGSTSC